ncbi:TolC family protein [Flexithrix dorotheae]|uniref:TolC family protein n=1 Tax=Flexithrix dorotheae TaxID=70993 RepID=UPI00146C5A5B|nr:TolC family protein [Flexithrix dorotheae]
MKLFINLIAIVLTSVPVLAQHTILENYIQEGLKSNLALNQENLALAKSLEELKQAKGLFMPDISFNPSYTLADGGRNISIPIGDLLNPIYRSLNQLSEVANFPTNLENSNEQFLPNRFHDTRIEIRQAIFNPDIHHNYKAQKSFLASQEAQRDVYVQELKKEIKTAYYKYLTTIEAIEIYNSTEKLLQELLRVNQKLVENDKATIDAVYRAEFELSDLNSQMAKANQLKVSAQSYFNFLLNRALYDSITVDKTITGRFTEEMLLENLQKEALINRDEILQLNYALSGNEQLLALNKNTRLPKLSLGANLGYQGFDYQFNNNQDYYLLQFNMSFPIFKGFQNKSKIAANKIEIQRLQTRQQELQQQIKFQVIDAYQQVKAEKSAVKAKSAALKSAKKSFEIIARKYLENQITLLDLLDARTKYTNAQLELVVAKYELLQREAALERTIAIN